MNFKIRSKSELQEEAEKLKIKQVANVESEIVKAMSRGWRTVNIDVNESTKGLYESLLTQAGFNYSYYGGNRATRPHLVVYL